MSGRKGSDFERSIDQAGGDPSTSGALILTFERDACSFRSSRHTTGHRVDVRNRPVCCPQVFLSCADAHRATAGRGTGQGADPMRQDPTAKRTARIEGEATRTFARRSNEQTPGRGPGEKRRRPGSISSAQVLTPPLAPTCRARKWDSQVTAGPPWAWL